MEKTRQAFLKFKGDKSQRQCAEEIGVTYRHLSRVLRGKAGCGKRLALRIEKWSGGALPAVIFLFPEIS
jgi:plasmid maintenance system antidote protein VapI